MIIKMTADAFGYKKDETHDLSDADAKALIEKGKAVEVEANADDLAEVVKDIDARIEAKASAIAEQAATKALAKALKANRPNVKVVAEGFESDPACGYKHFGEFALDVMRSQTGNGQSDRIKMLTKTNESTTSTVAIPSAFVGGIMGDYEGVVDVASIVNTFPCATGNLKLFWDNDYDFSNSAANVGPVASVVTENNTITNSVYKAAEVSIDVKTVACLVKVTDQLIQFNPHALGQFLTQKIGKKVRNAVNNTILNGSSAGTGIIGDASTLGVSRDTAGDVKFADLNAMFSRFVGLVSDLGKSAWVVSPTALEKIYAVSNANNSLFVKDIDGAPAGRLFGLPIIVSPHAAALGTDGDVLLIDGYAYLAAENGNGVKMDESIHLDFDKSLTAFRAVKYWGGRPGPTTVYTLHNGTQVSPFVQLSAASS